MNTFIKVKRRAVNNFTALCGDKDMADITREDALKFYAWWQERVTSESDKRLAPNSGNRDVGNMRKLYDDYFKHVGDEAQANPFRNLRFAERKRTKRKRPPFETEWIRDRILAPGALAKMNRVGRLIIYVLIETGCRPSEVCNLTPERIHLDAEVPYIEIDFSERRELKTESSVRQIPLVGVALEAMKRASQGFPYYLERELSFTVAARKYFRAHDLFPTEDHVIYSFRHSFEKRMTEAGLDTELRMRLMGHAIDRPEYGDGGSLEYRRNELLKIALPFEAHLFDDLKS